MSEPVGPPAAHVIEEELDDDIVLYDPQRRRYYELSPTAGDVWRLATGEFTSEEIVTRLAAAYQVEPSAIREEVERTLGMFRDAGLFGR